MDEQKVREAIEFLSKKIIDLEVIEDETNGALCTNTDPYKTAIEALEKQLPKKVDWKM